MAKAVSSANDVFINCPFDDAFNPIFQAFIFVILACGFRPRSARELDDGGQTRIDKIYALIEECRYGIHDLSRTECVQASGLPRFNMPLELGIFLGAKRYGVPAHKQKRVLILDIENYRYQRFISDLAGMDIHAHAGNVQSALTEVRNWLANVSRRDLPSAERVSRLHDRFLNDLPALAQALEFDPGCIPYIDFERIVGQWLLAIPAEP